MVDGRCRRRVVEEPLVGLGDAVAQIDPVPPARLVQPVDIEQLSRRSVGLAGVEAQLGLGVDQIANQLGQLSNRQILTGADVDVELVVPVIQEEVTGVGQIVDVQELAQRRPGAPDLDLPLPSRVSKPV